MKTVKRNITFWLLGFLLISSFTAFSVFPGKVLGKLTALLPLLQI